MGIFAGAGGPIATIADGSGPLHSFGFAPDINRVGSCAFFASYDNGDGGIFRGDGGPLTTIADTSGPLSDFGVGASINDAGIVAFGANFDSGGGGIVTGGGGQLTPIADSSGPYDNLRAVPDINNSGTVAFWATLDAGGHGIFTGPDPVNDKVIRTGDPLFGSTVTYLGFLHGLNDNGDVAFVYNLANGVSGVAVAAIPEPVGPVFILIGALVRFATPAPARSVARW
jgi:hypothetical protein